MSRWNPEPLLDKFVRLSIPEPNSGCYLWLGQVGGGYGQVQLKKYKDAAGKWRRIRIYAHRLAWQLFRGDVPDDVEVCHQCDNPFCVNPDHLFLGQHIENMRDRDRKLRHTHGEQIQWSKLTEDDVREIRRSSETGFVLSARYGVSFQTISEVKLRKIWKHVP